MSVTLAGGATVYPVGYIVPNPGQTLSYTTFNAGGAGNHTFFTVPAGQKFCVLGFSSSGANATLYFNIGNPIIGNGAAGTPIFSSVPIAIAAAGIDVGINNTAAGYSSLWGFFTPA